MKKDTLVGLMAFYRNFLFNNFLPFWEKYGIDYEYGGVLNCMEDDGKLVSEDKYTWSQARSLWTFSYIYNNFVKSDKNFEFIKKTYLFLLKHARDDNGDWVYRMHREGKVLDGAISAYVDLFAAYGITEYFRVTSEKEALKVAQETLHRYAWKIKQPDFTTVEPFKLKPGYKLHGIFFLFLNILTPLLMEVSDPELEKEAEMCVSTIINHFMDKKRKLIYEMLDSQFNPIDSPEGKDYMPGHNIECAWIFMIEAQRKSDNELMKTAMNILRWTIERSWDDQFGGFFWCLNVDNETPHQQGWDNKIYWVHSEALLALMLAYEITKENYYMDWFLKVHDYSFKIFPVKKYGEWYQRCDRKGNKLDEIVSLPVKDPYHVARAVMFIIESLERLIG